MEQYSSNYPKKVLRVFYKEMNEICSMNNVLYWDFSEDKFFYKHPELFVDTDYLNEKGAKLFTAKVIERVYDLLISK